MTVKQAVSKVDGDYEKLSKTLTTGLEAGQLISTIRDQGLVNIAF